MSGTPIAYVRIQRYDTPDLLTYAAVRREDVAAELAGSDYIETVQECQLDLPAEVTAEVAAKLAGPVRLARVPVGDVTGWTWASGPLVGQRRPDLWFRPAGMLPGYRCRYYCPDGARCVNVVVGAAQRCLAHQPGARWEMLPPPDDDEGD